MQQRVGLRLHPLDATLGAIHAQAQPVLMTRRNLARPQHASGAALITQQDLDVVVEPASRNERAQVGAKLVEPQARYVLREMVGMGADVTEATACACACR